VFNTFSPLGFQLVDLSPTCNQILKTRNGTIWFLAVLTLAIISFINITHTSLSLELCVLHLARMFFKKAMVNFISAF